MLWPQDATPEQFGWGTVLGPSPYGGVRLSIRGQVYDGASTAGEGATHAGGHQVPYAYLDPKGKRHPLILREAVTVRHHKEAASGDLWWRATGSRSNSFQGGGTRPFLPITGLAASVLASEHKVTEGEALSGHFGAGSILLAFKAGTRTLLAVLTGIGGSSGQLVYAFDPKDPAFCWASQPGDGTTGLPSRVLPLTWFGLPVTQTLAFSHDHQIAPLSFQFSEAAGALIVTQTFSTQATDVRSFLRSRVLVLSVEQAGSRPPGTILRDVLLTGGLSEGCGICDEMIVRLSRQVTYDRALRRTDLTLIPPAFSATPDARSLECQAVAAYEIPAAAPVAAPDTTEFAKKWQFDPFALFPPETLFPLIYQRTQRTNGNLHVADPAYAFGPGSAPAYAKKKGFVFSLESGRDGIPQCGPDGTWPAAYANAKALPANYTAATTFDNQATNQVGNTVSGITDVSPDAYLIRAWLVALDKSTGAVKARYDFPVLDARDESNYLIDAASFALAPSPQFLSATVATGSPAYQAYVNFSGFATRIQTARGLLDHCEIDLAAGFLATAGHPSLGQPAVGGVSEAYDTSNPAAWSRVTYTQGANWFGTAFHFLYPHWKFWPATAGYHFDACPWVQRIAQNSDDANVWVSPTWSGQQTSWDSPQVELDSEENLYLHYLQPVGIISARNPKSGNVWAAYRTLARAQATGLYFNSTTGAFEFPAWPDKPGSGGSISIEWFGIPRRYTMYRSFLASFTADLQLRWSVETTTHLVDSENGSGLALPHASHVFRKIPTKYGLYVLRTERVTFSGLPIVYNTARFIGQTKAYCDANYRTYNNAVGDHEPLVWARLVLEFRSNTNGSVLWRRVLWDPSAEGVTTPTCVPAAYLFADSAGNVHGRFDRATATWGGGGAGLHYGGYNLSQVVGTLFDANPSGVIRTRPATLTDPQAAGINQAPDNKARVNAAHCVVDGTLYYNGFDPPPGLNRWVIAKLAAT